MKAVEIRPKRSVPDVTAARSPGLSWKVKLGYDQLGGWVEGSRAKNQNIIPVRQIVPGIRDRMFAAIIFG